MSRNTLAFVIFSLSGCVSPGAGPFLCRESPSCPSGTQCVDGVCEAETPEGDASVPSMDAFEPGSGLDSARSDAFVPDANSPTRVALCGTGAAQCLDFEAGPLSGDWMHSPTMGGMRAEASAPGFMSAQALRSSVTNGNSTIRFIPMIFGSPRYISARVMVSRMGTPGVSSEVVLVRLGDVAWPSAESVISLGQFFDTVAARDEQTSLRLRATYSLSDETASAMPFTPDEWHCLELQVVDGRTVSVATGWIDNMSTGPVNGPLLADLRMLDIGLSTTSAMVSVAIDDVYFGPTRVGCLPPL